MSTERRLPKRRRTDSGTQQPSPSLQNDTEGVPSLVPEGMTDRGIFQELVQNGILCGHIQKLFATVYHRMLSL